MFSCLFLLIFYPLKFVLVPPLALCGLGFAWAFPRRCLVVLFLLLLVQPVAVLLMQFEKLSDMWIAAISGSKEAVLAIIFISLLCKTKPRLILSDVLIGGLILFALLVGIANPASPILVGLKDDFDFAIAYGVGRALVASEEETLWFVRISLVAVAIISLVGILEFTFFGPAPRMFLMGATRADELSPTFGAEMLQGFRAASTLTSPIEFGHICTIGLLFFAGYYKSLSWPYWIASAFTAGGLITSVTRSAWLGTVVGLCLIAVRTGQKLKLLALFLVAACILAALAPALGVKDFLALTLSGKEPSLQGHEKSLADMGDYVVAHPFGSGPGTAGVRALESHRMANVMYAESSYLHFGLEYGLPGMVLFAAFCASVVFGCMRNSTTLGVAGSAVALAFIVIYAFVSPPIDFPGAVWTWLPIGATLSCLPRVITNG